MFKRLLVPLDGSRLSSRALKYAVEIAHRFDAEVLLLQVVEPANPPVGTTGMGMSMGMGITLGNPKTTELVMQAAHEEDKRNASRARQYMSRKVRELKSQKIKASYHVEIGDPPEFIMSFARKKHADLIVMTTQGKSGLKRALLGSVADAVIRKSGVPVLTVGPQTKK